MQREPQSPAAWVELARAYLGQGDFKAATGALRHAAEIDPDYGPTRRVRGVLLDLANRRNSPFSATGLAATNEFQISQVDARVGEFGAARDEISGRMTNDPQRTRHAQVGDSGPERARPKHARLARQERSSPRLIVERAARERIVEGAVQGLPHGWTMSAEQRACERGDRFGVARRSAL